MKNIHGCLLFIGLMAGCNWTQLTAFRAQMRTVSKFTVWELQSSESVFVFKTPILTFDDLSAIGVFPERIDERHAVLRYHWTYEPTREPVECDIRLLFAEGRLAGLIFPAILRDALGQQNISGLFAMVGGNDTPGAGLSSLPKAQLVSAGLLTGSAKDLGSEISFVFEPRDSRNRPITLRLAENGRTDYYSSFHLKLGRSRSR